MVAGFGRNLRPTFELHTEEHVGASVFQAIVRAATAANKAGGPSPSGPRAELALVVTARRRRTQPARTSGGTTLGR